MATYALIRYNYTFTGIQHQTKWYNYTATQDGKLTIAYNNTSDYIEVKAQQDCNNNEIEPRIPTCDIKKTVFNITEGQTYYISIYNSDSSSPFDFSVTESSSSVCSNPQQAIVGNSNEADHTYGEDQWFLYTASSNGQITISSCELTTSNTYVSVFNNYEEDPIISNDDGCSLQSEVTFDCTLGQTYLIKWSNIYSPGIYNWSLTENVNTGINDLKKNQIDIKLHPNPAINEFHIDPTDQIKKVVIYNINGIKILDLEDITNPVAINVPTGLYFVKMMLIDETSRMEKLIVK
jgi:hypothetical protein